MTPHKYQVESIEHLKRVLPCWGAAVDGSDTGTGKTLVAVEVMKSLDLPTLVVAPKAVLPGWHRTAAAQGTELDAMNWEMLRTGRTPYGEWRLPSPRHRKERFYYNPGVKFLIFDEVHRAMSYQSKNAELVRAARRQRIPALALSATLADSPLEMDAIGYLVGLHDGDTPPTLRNPEPLNFFKWARRHGCGPGAFSAFEFNGTAEKKAEHMAKIHAALYPARGVRVRIPDLGDQFPETQITAELYDLGQEDKINALYRTMGKEIAKLKARAANDMPGDEIVALLRARQEVELLKVPVFEELAREDIRAGRSVAIFVNFRATLEALCARLGTTCFIDGSQTGEEGARQREANRAAFQAGRSRVIVCISEAGGLGLDLHDVHGIFPVSSYISAGYNAKTLRQVFGRVWRSGGLSKSLQRIIFAAGTVEEKIHRNISRKLNNLDALNDGDLTLDNLLFTENAIFTGQ